MGTVSVHKTSEDFTPTQNTLPVEAGELNPPSLLKRITGSHHIYTKQDVAAILSIPVHSNQDLPIGTLKSIMKDAGITEEDLR